MKLKHNQPNNRYREINLSLPSELSSEIKRIAHAHGMTEIEVIRKFFQLGLIANAEPLYIKKEGEYTELIIFEKPQHATVD